MWITLGALKKTGVTGKVASTKTNTAPGEAGISSYDHGLYRSQRVLSIMKTTYLSEKKAPRRRINIPSATQPLTTITTHPVACYTLRFQGILRRDFRHSTTILESSARCRYPRCLSESLLALSACIGIHLRFPACVSPFLGPLVVHSDFPTALLEKARTPQRAVHVLVDNLPYLVYYI